MRQLSARKVRALNRSRVKHKPTLLNELLTVLPPTDNIDKSELTIEVQNNATMPEYENLDLVGNDDNENEEIDSDKDNLADSDEDNVADSDEDNVDESETSYIIEDEFEDEDTDCIANLSEEEVHNIEGKVSEDIQLGCDTEQRIDDGLMESEYEIIELQLKNELLKQENSELESSVGKLSVLHNTLTSSYYDSLKKVAYLGPRIAFEKKRIPGTIIGK